MAADRGAPSVVALLRRLRARPAVHRLPPQLLRHEPASSRPHSLGGPRQLHPRPRLAGVLARAAHDGDLRGRDAARDAGARLRRGGAPEPPPPRRGVLPGRDLLPGDALHGRHRAGLQVALCGAGAPERLARVARPRPGALAAGPAARAAVDHGHGRVGQRGVLRDPDPGLAKDAARGAARSRADRRDGHARDRAADRPAARPARCSSSSSVEHDPLLPDLHRGLRAHARRAARQHADARVSPLRAGVLSLRDGLRLRHRLHPASSSSARSSSRSGASARAPAEAA